MIILTTFMLIQSMILMMTLEWKKFLLGNSVIEYNNRILEESDSAPKNRRIKYSNPLQHPRNKTFHMSLKMFVSLKPFYVKYSRSESCLYPYHLRLEFMCEALHEFAKKMKQHNASCKSNILFQDALTISESCCSVKYPSPKMD